MDNPVDHIVDLGLVNYIKHPTNPNYIVFRFADHHRADSFEAMLIEKEIWFEKEKQEGRTNKVYILFGVHKNDYNITMRINYDVEARHKQRFIRPRGLRYGLIVGSIIIMTLAVLGYCNQQGKLNSINNTNQPLIDGHLSE